LETAVPFRAWRYAPTAGDLALLIAPPYDVIDPALQSRLYARSRYNVVRVDLGMTTPSDNDCENRYTRAAGELRRWKDAGILVRDLSPTLTFVEEKYTGPDGLARVRHGFLAAVRLHDFSEGIVLPHERTFSGPKEDRFELVKATGMNLSPVFLLYDLPGDEISTAWSAWSGPRAPAIVVSDGEGTVTKLWPASDPVLLETVAQHLADARLIIADGHHRYETALRNRDHRRKQAAGQGAVEQGAAGTERAPAYEYVLAYLSNMADPGLAIYATHRLVSGVDPGRVVELPKALAGSFALDHLVPGSPGPAGVRERIERYLAAHPRGAFGVWAPATGQLYGLRLADSEAVATAVPGHSRGYLGLDVTILQHLVLGPALGIPSEGPSAETYVTFVKDTKEAFERLESGDFQVGFFMNPTGLEQVREVALAGERMPHKATFFYPKLPTGLVFQDLVGAL
jgi:uncharacterized protein (DUF1015 family)